MSCPQQRARGLQRSPERRSYAVAESGVRAPGREWRWFPEPRRTAHWCVVALCFSARVPTLSGALAAHLALTLPCFAPRLIRIVKLPAPECHALVVVAVWCQASITWPWAPQSRAIAWASQFVRAESVFDRVILTLRQTSSSHQDSNARSTDSASAITRCTRSLWYSWFLLQPHVAAVCGSRLRQRSLRAHAGRHHAGCGLGPRRACVVRGIRGAGFVCTMSCASCNS